MRLAILFLFILFLLSTTLCLGEDKRILDYFGNIPGWQVTEPSEIDLASLYASAPQSQMWPSKYLFPESPVKYLAKKQYIQGKRILYAQTTSMISRPQLDAAQERAETLMQQLGAVGNQPSVTATYEAKKEEDITIKGFKGYVLSSPYGRTLLIYLINSPDKIVVFHLGGSGFSKNELMSMSDYFDLEAIAQALK